MASISIVSGPSKPLLDKARELQEKLCFSCEILGKDLKLEFLILKEYDFIQETENDTSKRLVDKYFVEVPEGKIFWDKDKMHKYNPTDSKPKLLDAVINNNDIYIIYDSHFRSGYLIDKNKL